MALAATAAPASADLLQTNRGQPLDEIAHTVDVRIADGVATFTVQRQFRNRGTLAEEARLAIDLPTGAAATGLRIRANGVWHAGELLERELAAARYRQLTGIGADHAKDPALLFWVSPRELFLQLFPVLPGAVSIVEYTLTVPTRYAAGRYWVSYPRLDPARATGADDARGLVDPVLTIHAAAPAAPGAAITADVVVDGRLVTAGRPTTLPRRAKEPWHAQADLDGEELARSTIAILDVPADPAARLEARALLDVDLRHPSPSNLALALITPAGDRVPVHGIEDAAPRGGGAFALELPRRTRAAGRWRLVAEARGSELPGTLGRWSLTIGGQRFASTGPAQLIPGSQDASPALALIGVRPPPIEAWTGRLGRVVASRELAFSRLELDAAPRLSAVPKRAQVVFVLDASYSAGQDRLAAQLAMVRAYLTHVPDAELEVLAVRRVAARLFGRFVPARDAGRSLDDAVRRGALALGNGSALEDGARLAAKLLAGRPGPHRVVIGTDEQLRSSLADGAALAALAGLARDAVVHVVAPSVGGAARPSLERDDEAPLAPLAAAHHGIFARADGFPASPAALAPAVLELVRPTRIEGLAASGDFSVEGVLHEGEGVRIFDADRKAASAPSLVTLTGRMWSDPVRLEVAASGAFSSATAAFVFGEDKFAHLEEPELEIVAQLGRAVSPVTSYLAIEPGVRPSTIGLDDATGGRGRWGVLGSGSGTGMGYGTGGGTRRIKPDLGAMIATEACARTHAPARAWRVQLFIETTRDEIVDVSVQGGAGPLADCLVDAAWAVRLDARFDLERERFHVQLASP